MYISFRSILFQQNQHQVVDVLARFSAAFHDRLGGSAGYFEAGFSRIVMVLLGGRARRASVHKDFSLGWRKLSICARETQLG